MGFGLRTSPISFTQCLQWVPVYSECFLPVADADYFNRWFYTFLCAKGPKISYTHGHRCEVKSVLLWNRYSLLADTQSPGIGLISGRRKLNGWSLDVIPENGQRAATPGSIAGVVVFWVFLKDHHMMLIWFGQTPDLSPYNAPLFLTKMPLKQQMWSERGGAHTNKQIDADVKLWPSWWGRERRAQSKQDATAARHSSDLHFTHARTRHVAVRPCVSRPFSEWAADDSLTQASDSRAAGSTLVMEWNSSNGLKCGMRETSVPVRWRDATYNRSSCEKKYRNSRDYVSAAPGDGTTPVAEIPQIRTALAKHTTESTNCSAECWEMMSAAAI